MKATFNDHQIDNNWNSPFHTMQKEEKNGDVFITLGTSRSIAATVFPSAFSLM